MRSMNWKGLFLIALLLVGLVVGLVYIRTPQELRKKAALTGSTLAMRPASLNASGGNTFNVGIVLNAGPDSVTGAEIHVSYDPQQIEILGFEPGRTLQTVEATPPTFANGTGTITLVAGVNAYLKGSDIVGTLKVKALTDKPSRITFTNESAVAAIEKPSNTLVSTTGVTINDGGGSITPTCVPQPRCTIPLVKGQDNQWRCPTLDAMQGVIYCPITPTPTPAASCENARNGATCKRCRPCPAGQMCAQVCIEETATCQNGQCTGPTITITPTSTPPPGCYYRQVQCFRAPCDPILVCNTPTPIACEGPNGSDCTVTQCPVCSGPRCPLLPCTQRPGTCQNRVCIPNPTPTPTPPGYCPGNDGTACQISVCPTPICYPNGVCSSTSCSTISGTCINNRCRTTPTPTCIPRPACLDAVPACKIAERPEFCPRKTPTPTPRISRTPTPTPRISQTPTPTQRPGTQQTMEFRVKLAGVTGAEGNGAKISVKLYPRNGNPMQLSAPLTLSHVGNGVYKATAIINNPFAAGTQFRIKIKGEKHIGIEFCKQVGQAAPCNDTEYITVPNPVPLTYGFDLTGIALPPGDVPTQDGRVDRTDFVKMTGLMSKLCSSLSIQDKLTGDLDYSGCINVRDVFLMLQTLETRYDE